MLLKNKNLLSLLMFNDFWVFINNYFLYKLSSYGLYLNRRVFKRLFVVVYTPHLINLQLVSFLCALKPDSKNISSERPELKSAFFANSVVLTYQSIGYKGRCGDVISKSGLKFQTTTSQ